MKRTTKIAAIIALSAALLLTGIVVGSQFFRLTETNTVTISTFALTLTKHSDGSNVTSWDFGTMHYGDSRQLGGDTLILGCVGDPGNAVWNVTPALPEGLTITIQSYHAGWGPWPQGTPMVMGALAGTEISIYLTNNGALGGQYSFSLTFDLSNA